MNNNEISTDTITVTEALETPKEPEFGKSIWANIVPMVLIFVVLYFFLIRPQEKKRRQQESLINNIKKGEKVITSSGIYGTVHKINDNGSVELEIADKTIITITKSAIIDIVDKKNNNKTSPNSNIDKKEENIKEPNKSDATAPKAPVKKKSITKSKKEQ